MIGTVKLAALAGVITLAASAWAYLEGRDHGYQKHRREVAKQTQRVNANNRVRREEVREAIEAERVAREENLRKRGRLPYVVTQEDWEARQK